MTANVIKKYAKRVYEKHTFINEWQAFILFVIILKAAAMAFSIFAGYYYLNNLFISILNNGFWAKVFAILALILLEGLVAISLSKFYKFALRLELKAFFPAFLAFSLFAISFHISTRGLSLRQSKKVDNTEIITREYETHAKAIRTNQNIKKLELDKFIQLEKDNLQGWHKGRRSVLSAAQMRRIDGYYNDIKILNENTKLELNKIEQKFNAEISENNKHQNSEAEKYYKIVAVIMVLIFVINGLLVYFYSKIFNENEAEIATVEVINSFSNDITNKANKLIENRINDTFNIYFQALEKPVKKPVKTNPEIGFKTSEPSSYPSGPENDVWYKNINFLKRHKELVKTIKTIKKNDTDTISNSEIKVIQNKTKAEHKSRSLIKNVYRSAIVVGLDNL